MSSPASATTYGKYVDLQNYTGAAPSTSGSLYLSGSDASEILYTNIGMSVDGGVTAEGLLSGSSLAILGGTAMTAILDEDAMGSDSATALATQQSIKSYVDSQVAAGNNLSVEADTGGLLTVDLADDDFNIKGTSNEIEIAGAKAGTEVTFTVGLPDDVTIGDSLTVTTNITASGGTTTLGATTATTLSGSSTLKSGGNFTVGPSEYGLTTAGALDIASMAANWTNASRTVADMGIVTTMDLNGGSIDGTTIGAASAAAGTFAALAATTITGTVGSLTSLKVNSTIGTFEDTDLLTLEAGQLDVAGVISGSGNAEVGGNLTIGPSRYGLTSAGALYIASFSNNWTNASRTVADMGIVTTMDLNGGSIDGTTIGAASRSSIQCTTLDANGNVTLGNAATDVVTLTGQVTASANFLFKSSTSELPVVTIQNDNADDEGGVLRFMKESASPADSDYCGIIEFKAHDSDDNVTEYAGISGQCLDVTDTEEDGAVIIECMVAGTLTEVVQFWDGTNGLVLPNNSTYGTAKAHSFVTYSDETLKKNIQPIANPMDKLMLLQGVTYDWKEDGTNDIGFIAQDVEKVIPEVVYSAEGKEGSYGLDYASLTALLTEAIKQQQAEIDALKRRLDK